eukprot:135344_1
MLWTSDSDGLDLDLLRLKYKLHQEKRGHVTWASMKVIALIDAWTSTILLVFMISAVIAIATFMPDDISTTLSSGIVFLRSITDGYTLALQNLPPSSASSSSSLSNAIADQVQAFYAIPFPFIRTVFDETTVETLFPILATVPSLTNDVQDMIFYIQSVVRDIIFWEPTDYLFPSDRHYPFTVLFHDSNETNDTRHNGYSVNGEFIDLSPFFPGIFEKKQHVADGVDVVHMLFNDERWFVYQIISRVQYESNAFFSTDTMYQNMNLSALSVQFYEPMSNEMVILKRANGSYVNGDGTYQLRFNIGGWELLHSNVTVQQFPYLQPFDFGMHNQPLSSFQMHMNEIQISIAHAGMPDEVNGVYRKMRPDEQWKGKQYYLFDAAHAIEGLTTYIKENVRNNHSRSIYELQHKRTEHLHEIRITSHQITKLYQSREMTHASIDTVQWSKLNAHHDTMTHTDDTHAMIQSDNEFQIPHISKVILSYKQRKYSAWNTILCSPYLKYQDDALYFKIRSHSDSTDHIVARLSDVNLHNHTCLSHDRFKAGYLRIEPLSIRAEVLGGTNDGFAHVFFHNVETCDKWRTSAIATQQRLAHDVQESSAIRQRRLGTEWPRFIQWIMRLRSLSPL